MYIYGSFNPENERDEIYDRQILSIGAFLIIGNFIIQFSWLSTKLRTTWLIIENSLVKAFQFMIIPFLFMINFAICRFINDDEPFPIYHRFSRIFGEEYQQIFGENIADFHKQKPVIMLLYILGTLVINIVCLNILISVVTDNYDLVMQRI